MILKYILKNVKFGTYLPISKNFNFTSVFM